jgi:hypothetical protein
VSGLPPFLDELGVGAEHKALKSLLSWQFALVISFPVVLFGGVENDVGAAFRQKLVAVLFIKVLAVALLIRAEIAAHIVALVELDAAPVERFNNILFGIRHKARLVGVLNTENHFAAVLLGKQIVI